MGRQTKDNQPRTAPANGMIDRAQKEAAVVDACMARNGYIQAK